MAAASPTPMAGGHQSLPTRKSSLRSGLRRGLPRPELSRLDSNIAPVTRSSKAQYSAHDSSDDDEIPVPMKLSAITKALLNDGEGEGERDYGRVRTRAQSHRPMSPVLADQEKPAKRRSALNSSIGSTGEERRHTRSSSAQVSRLASSPARGQEGGEISPRRKRVVRLSATSSGSGVSSSAPLRPTARRSTSMSNSQVRNYPPSREGSLAPEERGNVSEVKDRESGINTPAQQARVVRIATGSAKRGRSATSSALSSARGDSASHDSQASHAEELNAQEEPQSVARQQAALTQGSVSRLGSRGRLEDNQALQSSMRIKRVGKVPGSFLSGPARRGKRRQSEEEEGENMGEHRYASQDPEALQSQDLLDLGPRDNLASSLYGPDRIASGSPLSARNSARINRKVEPAEEAKIQVQQPAQTSPERDEIPIPHYRVPPPRPDIPSVHDQENEAPPTFKRSKQTGISLSEKDNAKVSVRPLGNNEIGSRRGASPERKPLNVLSQNTPRRAPPAPPPKMSILDAATSTAGAATAAQAARRRNYMKVNGKCYTRLNSLGRGGSAKVYRVAADNGNMLALKRVSLEGADEAAVKGFKGEIDLLKRLTKVERVINLIDYEMNDEKQVLSLLMEVGELDLQAVLRTRYSAENSKFDPVFVRWYWQEMLECLASVHAYDVVHSDLKPANFVLVQGRLKLIDFGIANAIQTEETVNVHRETQIGTPNYMSPESLIDFNAVDSGGRRIMSANPAHPKLMKLGKPSDVWSLGCILYQMVYGQPPFGHIPNQMARCHAIINWQYAIEFRDRGLGDVPVPPSLLRTMKRCLQRDQHLRPTCEELLSPTDQFLYPMETPPGSLPISEELLGRIIQNVVTRCRERMPTDAEALSVWPQAYWGSVAKSAGRHA